MAWPPSPNTYFAIESAAGLTLKWGTDGIYSAYVVVSCSPSDEIENLYVENGTGMKVVRIQLWQGRRINITVVDDTTISTPLPGSLIALVDPLAGSSYNFRLIDNSYNAARKEAGQRVMVCEYLTMIEGSGSVPPHYVSPT